MPIIINEFEVILSEEPRPEEEQDESEAQSAPPALSPQILEDLLRRRIQRQARLAVY